MRSTPLKRRMSVSGKFILLSSSLIIIFSVIIALFFIRNEIRYSYQKLLNHGRTVAAMVSQSSEFGIYTEDQESLRQITKSLDIDPDIVYVAILDKNFRYLTKKIYKPALQLPRYSFHSIKLRNDIVIEEFRDTKEKNRYFDIMIPVFSHSIHGHTDKTFTRQPEIIGYAQLGLTQEGLRKNINQFLFSIFLFTSLFTLIGIALTVFIAKKITNPIENLNRATHDISEGKFDHHIDIRSNDEISDLAQAFNHMLTRLQAYKSEVETRTSELTASNQKLLEEIKGRKRIEDSLEKTKARLQHLLFSGPAVIYSCKPDSDFPFTFMSENVKSLLGHEPHDFLENPLFWSQHIHPDDLPYVLTDKSRLFERGYYSLEYRFKHEEGFYCWIRDELRLMRDAKGLPVESVGYCIDITERKTLEAQLLHDAFHDSLTKLPNRALITDRLEVSLSRALRHENYVFAVLFLDIDHFKNINDSLGHMTGDKLLIAIAKRLRKCLRPGDTVARLGGDEFALLIDDISDLNEVHSVAERIHKELSNPFILEGQEVFMSASIGISLSNEEYLKPEEMLRDADTAMYHAKSLGRGRHAIFSKSMHTQVVGRLELETDLRRALERNEFRIYYQPIFEVETGKIIGFEALLRWKHPVRGFILPSEFIHLAEENGLILPLGQWVLQESCRQMQAWQKQFPSNPPLTISVNVSSKQFSRNLIPQVKQILQETGLRANSLQLELTESVIMENAESAALLLMKLKEMDIQVHIDDFGTGYSSLSYLHHFPIDALKIDRSFISMLSSNGDNIEIVKLIITLGNNLNMDVIAEGVESPEQLEQLKTLECKYSQGYYFSKPLGSKEAKTFLETHH